MKNKVINRFTLLVLLTVLGGVSCTKLDVKLKDPDSVAPASDAGAPAPSSLTKVYEQLNQLTNSQENWIAMEEHTTDELLGPTRGTDWDDFGTWRKLHLHTWDGSHNQVNNAWNGLNGALFQTTLLAESASASPQEQAESKFLRAYFSYLVCDLYGQVQHRPATAAIQDLPDVYTRSEAIDFVISELESIVTVLPAYTHALRGQATREAAQFLLAKAYLNRAVFKQDPATPAGPYTFAGEDMNKVVTLCNSIATNPELSVSDYYWDNFTWQNGTKSTENIFVRMRSGGLDLRWPTCMGNHYNMPPDGWNGFTTLAQFYNSFEDGDLRKSDTLRGDIAYTGADASVYYPVAGNATTTSSIRLVGRGAGFLVGQQKGPDGKHVGNAVHELKDRSGNPLIFTPDVSLFFSTESKGIRTNKYPMDPAAMNAGGGTTDNEFVFFRFSDVRLMKAEAILRGATDAETALDIVNDIRSKRNASLLASLDLNTMLAERGRELYLEGWRRNDLIRFGKFNDPVDQRPNASEPTRVVFPIPNIALSSNPNLKQNEGY